MVWKKLTAVCLAAVAVAGAGVLLSRAQARTAHNDTTYVMDTIVLQTVYGKNGQKAATQLDRAFRDFEDRLSLYNTASDVAAVNAGAGTPVAVGEDTYSLLRRSLELSATSQGAFEITIAPVTLLWGVTGDEPHVPAQSDIDAALALVDDSAVVLNDADRTVRLASGQKIDLGGIAKGNACQLAAQVYEEYGVKSAVLNIGGNVYIRGRNPDGSRFRVGFRDPAGGESSYIASVELEDQVLAVSGGYERYFEENGVRYCHIMDCTTGWPVQTDVVSVGVVTDDGTLSDFMSTTLYIWGSEKTREYMTQHPELGIILLGPDKQLFVSKSLQDSFELTAAAAEEYTVTYL